MPLVAKSSWEAQETYGNTATYAMPVSGRRSKFAFWDAIGIARGSLSFRDDLTFQRHLGQGSQYVVDLYRYEPNNWSRDESIPDLIAVKTARVTSPVETSAFASRYDLCHFLHEIEILHCQQVRSLPNIIQFVSATWEESDAKSPVPRLMVEYTPLGNLSEYLRQTPPVPTNDKLSVMGGMSFALESLHRSGIIHGDVKLTNVLVFPGEGGSGALAKLTDFGCAITAMDDEESRVYRGTLAYYPPDLQRGSAMDMEVLKKCEVFVFGLSVWEILQNGKPYYATAKRIQAGQEDISFLLDEFDKVINSLKITIEGTRPAQRPDSSALDLNIDILILMELQNVVHSVLRPTYNTRPSMQEVADILEKCLQESCGFAIPTREKKSAEGPISDFGPPSCIWSFLDAQNDLPYQLQSQLVQALEGMLPSLVGEDLGYAFLILSYSATHGYGVPVDVVRSLQYLQKAADTGFETAQFLLPRILPALTASKRPEVDKSVLATASKFTTSFPKALSINSDMETLPQHTLFSLWWRRLNEFGQQKMKKSGLTLLTQGGIYRLPSMAEPESLYRLIESHKLDPSDCLIQTGEQQFGRKLPATHVLHFFATHGWVRPFREIRHQGRQLLINTSRPDWYTGLLDWNTNLLFSAVVNGRREVALYLLDHAIPCSRLGPSAEAAGDFPNLLNGLHFLGMFDNDSIEEMADRFVQKGADPNMFSNRQISWWPLALEGFPLPLGGGPPLNTAVWLRSVSAVNVLLALGADPQLAIGISNTGSGYSPVQLAVALHHHEIVEAMLTHLASRKPKLSKPEYAEDLLIFVSGEIVGGKDLWRKWVAHGSQWRYAAKRTIDLCIEHGANLSYMRGDGARPLALACQKHPCQLYIVEALLEAGCDPNERAGNDQGVLPMQTCLWWFWGDVEARSVLEILVKYNADLDLCSLTDGRSCAHAAAGLNRPKTLRFLKESGANLEIQDTEGRTPLVAAVVEGALDSVRQLLEFGVDVNVTDFKGETPLHLAIENGKVECIKLLLDHGANVEATTRCYVSNGIDLMNALELAAYWGRTPVLKIMLEHIQKLGYDPGNRESVLSAAVTGSELEALKFILRHTTQNFQDLLFIPNKSGNSLLHSAIISKEGVRHEMIDELIRAGIPVDFRVGDDPEKMSETALALSVVVGDIETVVMLLRMDASPYCRGRPEDKHWNFLHEAAVQSELPTNEFLRERFDDLLKACQLWIDKYDLLSHRDLIGRTALHVAVCAGQAGMAKSLIAAGSSVYDKVAKVSSANTPFNLAGLNALELAEELETFPAKKRWSLLEGVPDENIRAVIRVLKTAAASGDRQRRRRRLSRRLRKWRRHSSAKMEDVVGNARRVLSNRAF